MTKHLGYDNHGPDDRFYHTCGTRTRWGIHLRRVLIPCSSNTWWLMCTQRKHGYKMPTIVADSGVWTISGKVSRSPTFVAQIILPVK
ncbi:hypothetical protein HanPSC8_Chr08g0321761 [Helianthus annuus]|nr:hypothetical protein HanPSC8_Chr08g0321761 [Helianthus annuus]